MVQMICHHALHLRNGSIAIIKDRLRHGLLFHPLLNAPAPRIPSVSGIKLSSAYLSV